MRDPLKMRFLKNKKMRNGYSTPLFEVKFTFQFFGHFWSLSTFLTDFHKEKQKRSKILYLSFVPSVICC